MRSRRSRQTKQRGIDQETDVGVESNVLLEKHIWLDGRSTTSANLQLVQGKVTSKIQAVETQCGLNEPNIWNADLAEKFDESLASLAGLQASTDVANGPTLMDQAVNALDAIAQVTNDLGATANDSYLTESSVVSRIAASKQIAQENASIVGTPFGNTGTIASWTSDVTELVQQTSNKLGSAIDTLTAAPLNALDTTLSQQTYGL